MHQPEPGRGIDRLTARQVVTEDDVHDAMDALRASIHRIGVARGRAIKAEAMLRHIKALEMAFSEERSAAAQERDAYASDRYRAAIDELREATTEFETLKAERETAVMIVEIWRTQRASERAATRMT
jgi:hypothetical protein